MRILMISNLYPPHDLGGWEQICAEIVEQLSRRGHICHVLTSHFGVRGRAEPEQGVTRSLHLESDVFHYRPLDFFLRRPWRESANRRALRAALDHFRPDLVFIWGSWNLSFRIPYWAEQWLPGRVAYNIQGYAPIEPDTHRQFWSRPRQNLVGGIALWPLATLAGAILKLEHYPPQLQYAHVSCCSQYVADVLTEAGAIPPGAVAILNGIDMAPFVANARSTSREDATLRLLYFGGLAQHKGVHTAIEALGLLKQGGQADRLHLTLIGGGHPRYESYLQGLVRSLALEDKVSFLGRVPRAEIAPNLAHHDVFLFTSIYPEPFGRTIIEAMAAGLAVIGANVGGSREIFRFYPEDMTYPPGDAEALARQIRRFIEDPSLVQRLGQSGQELVRERFTLDRMVDEMEAWLRSIHESSVQPAPSV